MLNLKVIIPAIAVVCITAGVAAAKSRTVLLPRDAIGAWCFDREASDLKKQEGENAQVFRTAANAFACPADLDISLRVSATELRFDRGATCKVTGTSERKPTRFGFRCHGSKGAPWAAAFEIFTLTDGKLFVLDLMP